ncbi:ABC transporter substrate-binding protein [Methylobacterium indicum]|uniref:Peptide ABC transporter n=1 Tax=Methylobacterium indicum TaxID=1775910 RepID=A0ABR5H0A6_9HYPH|nr:ABC transporter substrate-binding protein [Methylobacterium indicum]KMO15669.1 peptide ABC transporter [Methylobacterium indicum]KMO16256.1 peptide ABC transporter [Methylobacterium indicum]
MAPTDRPRPGLTRRALATGLALGPLVPVRSFAQGGGTAAGGMAGGMGSVNLAMVGEPQSLDPMASTADLVATIMQHVFEPLYTFDASWAVQPMLAAALPTISPDGKTYTIALREGVPLHNGRALDSEDVVASLKRWMEMTPRGKGIAAGLTSLSAKGPHAVEIVLKAVNPALLAHLALPSGFAAIMAREAIASPLTEFVGTGPYRFKERRPDQFVVLTRHDSYAARSEAPSGYAGRRTAAIPELRFIPVPNANTRVEGVVAGQYHFADQLPVESNGRIAKASGAKPVLTMPFGFPYLVLNTRQGPCADLTVRQALQMALSDTELLMAAFGEEKFFEATGSHFPKGSPFHSTAGTQAYDRGDDKGAKALLAEARYDGTPIRILNSKQYDFHNRIALVMAEELRAAGFKVTLDVVDWATLVSRRGDPALWDVYVTHSAFLPEPMLTPPQLGDGAPGWWDTPAKKAALSAFNAETDPGKRGALWGPVQEVIYREVPYIRVGNFAALSGLSGKLKGFAPMPWPAFWNVEAA